MSVKKYKRQISVEEIQEARCDKCDKALRIEFDHDGSSNLVDGKEIIVHGGYWSSHEMSWIECVFCQDCLFELLMPYGKMKSWYEE